MGAMGEDVGRFFANQMLDALEYMHTKRVVHRDLKLENILVDDDFNLKIADFGFACYKNIEALTSYRGTMTYMAPEIKEGKTYKGTQVDLFSLGVILFILYSGHPPFSMANEEDNYYKLLATNRSDLFWKAHSNPQRKAADFYSEDFKDLLTCMMQFHPHQRLCIADIIGHPWLASGNVASAEAVREEFANRHEVNKQRAWAEAERKQATRASATTGARRDFKLDGKTYLSHEDVLPENATEEESIRLNVKDYNESQGRTHAFFSHFRPDYLFTELTKFLVMNGQTFVVSDQTWKLNFEVKKQINEAAEEG